MAVKSIFAVLVFVVAGSAFAAKEPTREEGIAAMEALLGQFVPKNEAQIKVLKDAHAVAIEIMAVPDGAPFCGIVNLTEEEKKAYVEDVLNAAIKGARISKPPEEYRYFAEVLRRITPFLVKDMKAVLARGLTPNQKDNFCQKVKAAMLENEQIRAVVRMLP